MCKVIGCEEGIFRDNYCKEHYEDRKRTDEALRKAEEKERSEEENGD